MLKERLVSNLEQNDSEKQECQSLSYPCPVSHLVEGRGT